VERGLPNYLHSRLQFLVLLRLIDIARDRPVFPCPELRLKLAPDIYRISNISVFAGTEPTDRSPRLRRWWSLKSYGQTSATPA